MLCIKRMRRLSLDKKFFFGKKNYKEVSKRGDKKWRGVKLALKISSSVTFPLYHMVFVWFCINLSPSWVWRNIYTWDRRKNMSNELWYYYSSFLYSIFRRLDGVCCRFLLVIGCCEMRYGLENWDCNGWKLVIGICIWETLENERWRGVDGLYVA